jgi:Ca-activated chloride channel homolog
VVEAAAVRRAVLVAVVAVLALPAAARAQSGGTPIVGGGSFNTAPLLQPGSYSDTVAAGETVYYKIHMQKGQILSATATIDTSAIETDFTSPNYNSGLANLDYSMDIYSPLREQLSDDFDYTSASANLEGSEGAGAVRGTATGPRVLGYEQILGPDYDVQKFPGPGDWYISVTAADSKSNPANIPAELPLTLDVKVTGTPEPSSPNFAAALPAPPPPSATGTPTAAATPTEPLVVAPGTDAGDPTLTIGLVALLALGGGLALGVLAVIVLGVGRRRRSAV